MFKRTFRKSGDIWGECCFEDLSLGDVFKLTAPDGITMLPGEWVVRSIPVSVPPDGNWELTCDPVQVTAP
jgi:hypothetical protein